MEPEKPVLQKPPGYRDPTLPPVKPILPTHRKPVLPPSFPQQRRRGRTCCRTCCCICCSVFFILLLLLAIASAVFYVWFQPQLPEYHLRSFELSKFNFSTKSDGTYLDSKAVLRVEVKNSNKKIKVFHGKTQVKVTVGEDTDLGTANMGGFGLGTKNTTLLKFVTERRNGLVDDSVGTKLKKEFKNEKLVVVAEVKTSVGFGVNNLRTAKVEVSAVCGKNKDVTLKKLGDGTMPKCTFYLFKCP
ncbi:hypothetical protein RJ641_016686 [Dillenia turbinata]|uniref:Late embryogenesis abundant protein LEA-2 subgroup domain-containing protein n=1 Tax=Dillenia turbinata TaxID=194707 RepID=A0AAN8UPW7_9MAGN